MQFLCESVYISWKIHYSITYICKTAMRGTLDAAKRVVPHLIAHKVANDIADAAKKRKRVDIIVKRSQEPQSKKTLVDTGGIDINALIGGPVILLG